MMASFENNATNVLEDDDEEEENMNVVLCSACDRWANDERRIAAVNISQLIKSDFVMGMLVGINR